MTATSSRLLTLTIDGESNGSVIRVMAMNEAGVAESGLVTLALACREGRSHWPSLPA